MTRTVRGARVLITGAASGMGYLFAERAVREGAAAVVLWDRDEAALSALTARLRAQVMEQRSASPWGGPTRSPSSSAGRPGTTVHPFVLDLAELGAIAQTAQAVRKELDGVDVIVNAAGIVRSSPFWEHDNGDDTRRTMLINALAPMHIAREFLPAMISSAREARIVTIAGGTGAGAGAGAGDVGAVHSASVAAVVAWSDSLRAELRHQGFGHVRVTAVVRPWMLDGAVDPLLARVLTPERMADGVWKAMLAGRKR
ncbi:MULTISPECIES: SDR family NAD(P)-dependent oxidoreductase [unclassified Leifsonia]|uniref:SDR family NAD(P)-dependent oxidoreductase n=1 Tax=unclassified Leifsonia TaxID=2663824 RepID=UPI000A196BAB|nr:MULTISPECIES: SDR family NAD(P)-dependent oxidoreductase [unclassified Leifsonia]QJA00151.1 SDR family NAD(P)-dependent oxidoreductase [Leifsonia sp. PS1209]